MFLLLCDCVTAVVAPKSDAQSSLNFIAMLCFSFFYCLDLGTLVHTDMFVPLLLKRTVQP